MVAELEADGADPGRLYEEGRRARVALETAREQVAGLVGARPREVVFTATGTEAVNTAIAGAVARGLDGGRGHVVTSAVEHSAVLEACRRWARDVTIVGVDELGRVDAGAIEAAVRDDTALVSVQTANHEVGTRQPVDDVAARMQETGALLHVDACASVGHDPLDFGTLGADLCSITAHKLGGPAGIGALLVRRGLRVPPLVLGGEQERARRGGMENLAATAGFGAVAVELSEEGRLASESARDRARIERLRAAVRRVEGVVVHGDPDAGLPHLVSLSVEGVEAEPVLLGLDQAGIAAHSGSACSSETLEPSPVLEAMGADAERSLRLSVGWATIDSDVDRFAEAFPAVVERLRSMRTRPGP